MTGLVVEKPGLLTTLQDAGRRGWQHLGVSVSGWMDDWSARLANRLAGNGDDAALLEITLVGPTLRAESDLVMAVTGAEFDVVIGSRRLRSPLLTLVRDGETISFGARRRGTRAYLACRGGLAVETVLGSRSSDLRAGLGGGRLERGVRLAVGDVPQTTSLTRELQSPEWLFDKPLHVLAGHEDAQWTRAAMAKLCASRYTVSVDSNRTGYRLEGPVLPPAPGTLVTAPVVAGTVQVPPSGQPILLMAECQTSGGYAPLGAIAAADRAVAAQLGPGDAVAFAEITFADAAALTAERQACLEQMVESAR